MKSLFITLGVLCLAVTAAAVIYSNLHNAAPTAPPPEVAVAQPPAPAEEPPASKPSSLRSVSNLTVHSNDRPAFTAHRAASNSFGDPAADALKQSVAVLVSRNSSFRERQAVLKQLRDASQLDQAIDELKQGAANNPDSPEYQAALGQAYLQKAGVASRNGASTSEMGILGLSADQSFDAALKADPANWDAQFFKAVAMSYWPAEMNKGDEVVQRLSGLINQQDTLPSQPEFAMPYVALGQEYQKLGQSDNALQTWQAGAAKFPNDPTLQQKLTAAQAAHQ
jgi:tetratricopeptide (TPR) repeat protein